MKVDRRLVAALAVPLAVASLSGLATSAGVRDWYPSLVKPSFTPPDWVFGPAWTILYIMMGIALWWVWRRQGEVPVRTPLTLFAVQLALNALWSVLFFGLRWPGAALVDILLLWVAIGLTIRAFRQVSVRAAVFMLPYWAWVTFATALNASIWVLNR
ncbi:MAG: tryptophan-rich sensory protein [marine benthic group bacterium]|nr:tryptophan-rich sensory protein [Gemmatimonadota bacterium]